MKKQQGNVVTIVVIVILIAAVLGLLGYVFWTKFVASKPATTTDSTKTSQQTATEVPDLSKSTSITYKGTTLSVNYPSTWTFDDQHGDGSYADVTSPDSKVNVGFNLNPPDGLGGTCGDSEDANPVMDPVISSEWSAIPGVSQTIFAKYIIHYLANPASGNPTDHYTYGFGAVRNTDGIKNVKAGESACAPFIFAQYVDLNVSSGAVLDAQVDFSDLDATAFGDQKKTNTQAQIEEQFSSSIAATAEAIIKSISLK